MRTAGHELLQIQIDQGRLPILCNDLKVGVEGVEVGDGVLLAADFHNQVLPLARYQVNELLLHLFDSDFGLQITFSIQGTGRDEALSGALRLKR